MIGDIVAVRSGGDVASGIIQKLHRSGFRVLVLETANPTSIRRTVCFSETVFDGKMVLEDITAVLVHNKEEIFEAWSKDNVPVIVDPDGSYIKIVKPEILVDAILAKKNLGMHKELALVTIAIGPGFEAGKDVDIVIESNRGHNLGRLIFSGSAEPDTGIPGNICGFTVERVLHSPCEGIFKSQYKIGDTIKKGEIIATVGRQKIHAQMDGLIRGLIRNGTFVTTGFKVGDIDPRIEQVKNYCTISDKARAIGGAVLEAVMIGKRIKEDSVNL